jgi:hypothetical protein
LEIGFSSGVSVLNLFLRGSIEECLKSEGKDFGEEASS